MLCLIDLARLVDGTLHFGPMPPLRWRVDGGQPDRPRQPHRRAGRHLLASAWLAGTDGLQPAARLVSRSIGRRHGRRMCRPVAGHVLPGSVQPARGTVAAGRLAGSGRFTRLCSASAKSRRIESFAIVPAPGPCYYSAHLWPTRPAARGTDAERPPNEHVRRHAQRSFSTNEELHRRRQVCGNLSLPSLLGRSI